MHMGPEIHKEGRFLIDEEDLRKAFIVRGGFLRARNFEGLGADLAFEEHHSVWRVLYGDIGESIDVLTQHKASYDKGRA